MHTHIRIIAINIRVDSAIMMAGPYPNTLMRVACKLPSVRQWVQEKLDHLPIYTSCRCSVFALVECNMAVEAINYYCTS